MAHIPECWARAHVGMLSRQVKHGMAPHPFVQVDAAPCPGARTFPQVPPGSWASACWQNRLVPPSQHWLVVEQPSVSVAHLDQEVGSRIVRLAECSTFLSSACVGWWRAGQRWAAEQTSSLAPHVCCICQEGHTPAGSPHPPALAVDALVPWVAAVAAGFTAKAVVLDALQGGAVARSAESRPSAWQPHTCVATTHAHLVGMLAANSGKRCCCIGALSAHLGASARHGAGPVLGTCVAAAAVGLLLAAKLRDRNTLQAMGTKRA